MVDMFNANADIGSVTIIRNLECNIG